MDERLRESLSAMLDGEADELTVRRVLALGDDEQVQSQWLRWQRLRDQLQGQDPRWSSVDLRAGIWAQLDAAPEKKPQQRADTTESRAPKPAHPLPGAGKAALAAMFVVALGLGFGAGQQWPGAPLDTSLAGAGSSLSTDSSATASEVPQVSLGKLNAAQKQHLSDYLLRHARHNSAAAGNGAVGFARLASVSNSGGR